MAIDCSHQLPSIYARPNDIVNERYPAFQVRAANSCEDIEVCAQATIDKCYRGFSLRRLVPSVRWNVFSAWNTTTFNGQRNDVREIDIVVHVVSVIVGGIITVAATLIFGSFYRDFQDARIRIDSCQSIRGAWPDVFSNPPQPETRDLQYVVDVTEKLAREKKQGAMINMSLVIATIAATCLFCVAGVFGSSTWILFSVSVLAVVGLAASIKWAVNMINKIPARKAQSILDATARLRALNSPFLNRERDGSM